MALHAFGIMPTNKRLMALDPTLAGPESRGLIERWGTPHAVRSALGLAATAVLLLGIAAIVPRAALAGTVVNWKNCFGV